MKCLWCVFLVLLLAACSSTPEEAGRGIAGIEHFKMKRSDGVTCFGRVSNESITGNCGDGYPFSGHVHAKGDFTYVTVDGRTCSGQVSTVGISGKCHYGLTFKGRILRH